MGTGTNAVMLYLNSNGRWQYLNGQAASSATLRPLEGYYYLHRGTGFVWQAEER